MHSSSSGVSRPATASIEGAVRSAKAQAVVAKRPQPDDLNRQLMVSKDALGEASMHSDVRSPGSSSDPRRRAQCRRCKLM